MSAVLVSGGLRGVALPPLYSTEKGFIGRNLIVESEVDQLRVDAIRRCEGVVADLQRMKSQRQVTFEELVDAVYDPARFQRNLVESVPFESAEIVERAAERLERVIGTDGLVADPRCEYIGSMLSMGNVREMVAGMVVLIERYRKARAQLK